MEIITKQQIKSIYALGASLGLVEHGSRRHDDALHMLVAGLTGKESVSQLNSDEATKIISELMRRMKGFPPASTPKKKYSDTPGGMTTGQQRKVWSLMYELKSYDRNMVAVSLGDRLCGIIKRQFGMDASPREPFRFLDFEKGRQLIEILKKYCTSAEMRKLRAGGSA